MYIKKDGMEKKVRYLAQRRIFLFFFFRTTMNKIEDKEYDFSMKIDITKRTDDDRIKVASTSLDEAKKLSLVREISIPFLCFFLNRLHAVSTRRIDKKKRNTLNIYIYMRV